MIKQWGKKPGYLLYTWINWRVWALPLRFAITKYNSCIAVSLEIFCFGFEIERWVWND